MQKYLADVANMCPRTTPKWNKPWHVRRYLFKSLVQRPIPLYVHITHFVSLYIYPLAQGHPIFVKGVPCVQEKHPFCKNRGYGLKISIRLLNTCVWGDATHTRGRIGPNPLLMVSLFIFPSCFVQVLLILTWSLVNNFISYANSLPHVYFYE